MQRKSGTRTEGRAAAVPGFTTRGGERVAGSLNGLQAFQALTSWEPTVRQILGATWWTSPSLPHRPQRATMMSLQDQLLEYFLSSWTLCLHTQMTALKNN